jgi:shikimate dehydrogenase
MGKLFAVIGDPVAHSLSPQMQNAAIRAMGLDAEYIAVHVRPEELSDFVKRAKTEFDGFNITVPHKNAVIPFLDEISGECRRSESVNTVSNRNGTLYGESTDGYGLETAIFESFGIPVKGGRFCFLGCGGAALAVAFHFAAHGAVSLAFVNRTVSKAAELAERLASTYPDLETAAISPDNGADVRHWIASSVVTVQATSLGLRPDDPPPVDPELLEGTGTCFYETIYKETPLLRKAREANLRTADGRGMLLHQGARSLAIWTGGAVPVTVMRQALDTAITSRMARQA